MTGSLTVLPAHCERRVMDAIAWPQSVRLASWPTVRFATTTVTTVAPLNHDRYNAETAPSCLVTASARSWQSGGRGSAAVAAAVSWWNGYRRAGGHRLFTANDPEPTGIARLPLGVRDSQSGCRTMRTGNNRDCQDLRIANPLVAGSSPARPTSEPILSVRRRQLIDHSSFTRALSG